MNRHVRLAIGVGVIVVMLALIVVGDALRRNQTDTGPAVIEDEATTGSESVADGSGSGSGGGRGDGSGSGDGQNAPSLAAGAIPLYLDGELIGGITAEQLDGIDEASFVDAEEGRTQRGWLVRDVLLTRLDAEQLSPATEVTISSSVREKTATLTWAQIADTGNNILFDLSGRGTFKLAAEHLEMLDTRDEWVQDVDRIEVITGAS